MKPLLFIHIPKCAGRSITEQKYIKVTHFGHTMACYIKDIEEYYSFTITRNPYDRFMSSYYFYRDLYEGSRKIGEAVNWYKDFEDFTMNFSTFNFKDDQQFVPQYKYLVDQLDYIGRFEYLELDWKVICLTSDRTYHPLPHINVSKHLDWQEEYTQEMKDIIGNLYKIDFSLLDYEY